MRLRDWRRLRPGRRPSRTPPPQAGGSAEALPGGGRPLNRRLLFWALLLGLLVLDLGVKHWARTTLAEHQAIPLWPGVFELTLTYNEGIAFGLFQGSGVLLAPIAVAIAIGAIVYNVRHSDKGYWGHVAAALLASGALGNLYDRIVLRKVTDMLWVRAINFPVFNIADACITVAAGMLILTWLRDAFVPAPNPVDPQLQPPAETSTATAE